MKVYVDSDIILDLLLKQAPFHSESEELFNKIGKGDLEGYSSPLALSNVYCLIHDVYKVKNAKSILKKLRLLLSVMSMDQHSFDNVLASEMKDLEDAIQYYCCMQNSIDHIVTRSKKDYKASKIPVSTAKELLSIL